MTRDEKKYQGPESFNPDRYFGHDGKLVDDDISFMFGFGRRCASLSCLELVLLCRFTEYALADTSVHLW